MRTVLERSTAEQLKVVDESGPHRYCCGCGVLVIEVYWLFHTFDTTGVLATACRSSNSRAVIETAADREAKR